MLFRRFHEDVLRCFGFKKIENSSQVFAPSPPQPSVLTESGVSYKPPHPTQSHVTANNSFMVGDSRDKSSERMPPLGHPNTMSQDLRPSNLPGKPLDRRSNLSQNQIVKPPPPPPPQHIPLPNNLPTPSSQAQTAQSYWNDPYDSRALDLTIYPAPHPASPLSKHLNKLLPPN